VSAVQVGDSRELVVAEDLTRTQIVQYAGASGDYNPLHSDERFAKEVAGYPSIFAHGMLTMGMSGRVLTDWFGAEALLSYGARFQAQVWPGDRLTTTATVTALRQQDGASVADLTLTTVNQAGAVVLSGTASARVDG
jgi:acyl dehydratase